MSAWSSVLQHSRLIYITPASLNFLYSPFWYINHCAWCVWGRLNLVKIFYFGLDPKNMFLTHLKTVFWVTDHFCIKLTFWKNVIFCLKNAFFWQKWQFDPLPSAAQRQCQGTIFSEGIFLPIFGEKKCSTTEQKCPGHFNSSQLSPKSVIFGGFEKKSFQKWLKPKTYCVCYPNTLLYMVLDHLWAKKCHDFGQKL